MPFSLRLAALLLTSSASLASAQVGGSVAATLQQPALSAFKKAGNTLTGAAGTTVKLTPKGSFVESAAALLPGGDPHQAGRLLGALIGEDVEQDLVAYLKQPTVQYRLPLGLTVAVGAYDLKLQTRGKTLTMNVSLHQVTGFAAVPGTRVLGDPAAPIVIRMYSDLQCPYCQQAELDAMPTVVRSLQTQKDVRLEFHYIPLIKIHPNARPAAEAAVCAENQGQFWAFKDALFRRDDWQHSSAPQATFQAVAARLNLNAAAFRDCLTKHSGKAMVEAGLSEAENIEIQGTPTVFVNGYQVPDPDDAASYQAMIDFVRAK
ncbi:DsbA family protein [Deinococcus ruber]|uniref:Thioredoxin domain-containing protein n=1 Tax=Deinococcus ruber TaxID=1848197 RepID=A0A918C046_9DEIO|nr:thioredoxin domain-containing protein [Deinococcus ruber]GGR00513.1 hypothetical protein GCM10008957_11680 [Deinococcus ruber]